MDLGMYLMPLPGLIRRLSGTGRKDELLVMKSAKKLTKFHMGDNVIASFLATAYEGAMADINT